MKIWSEREFRRSLATLEALIEKGMTLGDMDFLNNREKRQYALLSQAVHEWESTHDPIPALVPSAITDAIRKRMEEEDLRQKEVAVLVGVSESRMSDILNGRRPLNLNIVKKLRDNLGMSADFILDNLD